MTCKLRIGSNREVNQLTVALTQGFQWLNERGYSLQIKQERLGTYNYLLLSLQGPGQGSFLREEDMVHIFKYQLAEVIAEDILDGWETELVRRRIDKKYRVLSEAEKQLLCEKAVDFLKRCNENESLNLLIRFGRKNKITHRIFDHLHSNDVLILDGFINFCLQDYLTEINFAVELADEEIRNEREYNEFIKLLRYFVDSQSPRIFEVHLMVTETGLFYMWDGNGNLLEEQLVEYYLDDVMEQDINIDDILVSILITIAPRRIVVHEAGKVPETESLKIVKKVFGDRIFTCVGCERCEKNPHLKNNDW